MATPIPSPPRIPTHARRVVHVQAGWRGHLAWWSLRARAWWWWRREPDRHPAVELLVRGDRATLDRLLADLDADEAEHEV